MYFFPVPYATADAGPDNTLLGVLTALGLTSGLQLCLDAGDIRCWDGSTDTQLWKDSTGNGYHFYRGAGSGAGSDDPTFTGTPGDPTAYWSADGGDVFTLAQSNPAWINNMHKDNAVFSMLHVFHRSAAVSGSSGICGTRGNVFTGGMSFDLLTGNNLRAVAAGGGVASLNQSSTDTINVSNAWNFVGLSLDESVGANGGTFVANANNDLFTSTYSAPTSSDAAATMQLLAYGGSTGTMTGTTRLAMTAMWSGVRLSASQLNDIRLALAAAGRYL